MTCVPYSKRDDDDVGLSHLNHLYFSLVHFRRFQDGCDGEGDFVDDTRKLFLEMFVVFHSRR